MNPVNLLNVSQAFRKLKREPDHYKLPVTGLPKFTKASRPVSLSPAPKPEAAQTSLFQSVPSVSSAPSAPSASSVPSAPSETKDSSWDRLVAWCSKVMEEFILGRKSRRTPGAGVQAELALEKVRVLRNDLSEDDLEVVTVDRKVGPGEKPATKVSAKEITGQGLDKVHGSFLQTKQQKRD